MGNELLKDPHPMQPIVLADNDVIRFKANKIVRFLLDWASQRGIDMNTLAIMPFSQEDRAQFAQLIGYSVSGYGELQYAIGVEEADGKAEELLASTRATTHGENKNA